jgi:hypothetical protein
MAGEGKGEVLISLEVYSWNIDISSYNVRVRFAD